MTAIGASRWTSSTQGGTRQPSESEQNKNTFDRACPADYQSRRFSRKKSRMALRPIIILPDPKLRLVSKKIERVDNDLRRLIDDMIETMHDAPGVGLAGHPGRRADPCCWWSTPPRRRRRPTRRCSSIPRSCGRRRSARPTRRAAFPFRNITPRSSGRRPCAPARSTARGRQREILAEGLLATVLQHEIDHLDGVLFIDHISKLKRDRVIKKFQKAAKRAGDGSHVL